MTTKVLARKRTYQPKILIRGAAAKAETVKYLNERLNRLQGLLHVSGCYSNVRIFFNEEIALTDAALRATRSGKSVRVEEKVQ